VTTPAAAPQRIQRRRVKGWKMPEGAIYVGRGRGAYGRWGNPVTEKDFPFVAITDGVPWPRQWRTWAVEWFEQAVEADRLYGRNQLGFTYAEIRDQLAGRDLACWCSPDLPCHADVLLRIANAPQ
jgi:uncharacterized protein DUF4326